MNANTMTRRAVLAGVALASAAGSPAVASTAVSVDPAVSLWRTWWGHAIEWHRLSLESRRIWDSLPDEVQRPRVWILERLRDKKPKVAWGVDDIERLTSDCAYWPMRECEKERRAAVRVDKLAEFAAREREADAAIVASGHDAIVERMCAVHAMAAEIEPAIEAMQSTTSAAIAARCHFALDGMAQLAPDVSIDATPASRGLSLLIRDLLPDLPADMAAAMAPVADGWRPLRHLWGVGVEEPGN